MLYIVLSILYCIILPCIILNYITSTYTILRHDILYYAILLYYAMLWTRRVNAARTCRLADLNPEICKMRRVSAARLANLNIQINATTNTRRANAAHRWFES